MRPRPRPDLEDLAPYKTSDVATGRIWLHANENPYPPPDDVVDEIFAAARKHPLNRYPSAGVELRAEIASYAGVDVSWVSTSDGSNELLLQACLAFGGTGRKALLFEPTYPMHHRQARMAGTDVVLARRGSDFAIDPFVAIESIEADQPDVVFVCSPNNPTGTVTGVADIANIAEASSGLVIVDEAYYEFSGETFVTALADHPNVIVIRTMSKAFRLASVRLGYAIAHPDVLGELARVRLPYSQSAFSQAAALIALQRRDALLDAVPKLIAERGRLAQEMGDAGMRPYDSRANFILFKPRDADRLLSALGDRGVVIRDFRDTAGCGGCLRVTVGTPAENDEFLAAVKEVAT